MGKNKPDLLQLLSFTFSLSFSPSLFARNILPKIRSHSRSRSFCFRRRGGGGPHAARPSLRVYRLCFAALSFSLPLFLSPFSPAGERLKRPRARFSFLPRVADYWAAIYTRVYRTRSLVKALPTSERGSDVYYVTMDFGDLVSSKGFFAHDNELIINWIFRFASVRGSPMYVPRFI